MFSISIVLLGYFTYRSLSHSGQKSDVPLVCATEADPDQAKIFSKRIADVVLQSMESKPVLLYDLAGERFTVVLFCSYKCPCSDGYVQRLAELKRRYERSGIAFLAIDSNTDETFDGMKTYIDRRQYPLRTYRDMANAAADMLGALVTPEVFVFDHNWSLQYHGRIDDDKSGEHITDASLQNALDTLSTGTRLQSREKLMPGCAIVRAETEPDAGTPN